MPEAFNSPAVVTEAGFSALPNGRGGTNVESIAYTEEMGFDRHRSLQAFLTAVAEIRKGMILGADKNVYLEPAIWTIEWARNFYGYPVTRSS